MLQHNEFEKNPFRHFAEGKNCEKVPLGRENDAAMTIL